MKSFKILSAFTATLVLSTCCISLPIYSCSRLTYTASEETTVIGRSMDWVEDIKTDLWAFPAGMVKSGSDAPNSVKWTSKYGSVIASGYNLGSTDGINTQGLDANLLYLASADYGTPSSGQPVLSVLQWAQYALDNYATVDEAVNGFKRNNFHLEAKPLPNGRYAGIHLSLSDKSGDNAIFEYVKGELTIYHNRQYTVMTNEPTYEKQLALNDYWQRLKGCFLPGTTEPSDRFVRASYYLQQASKAADEQQAVATVFSIIRNVSQPILNDSSDRPNQAPTIWRSVADLKRQIYYFEITNRPNVFWVDAKKLNLNSGAPVKKLALADGQVYAGEVSSHFIPSTPF